MDKEIKYIALQPTNINNCNENTIDLRELFLTILKYKKLIFLITFFVTVFSIIYVLYFATPIYRVKANIQSGFILTDTEATKRYFNSIYSFKYYVKNLYDKSNTKQHFPKVNININKKEKEKSILIISIEDKSEESALNKFKQINNDIKKIEKKQINIYTKYINKKIATLNNNIDEVLKITKDLREKYKNTTDGKLKASLISLITSNKSKIMNIKKQIEDLKIKISPDNILKTKIIANIEREEDGKPIKPKKKLIVIVSFITALLLSIFIVFFIEFLKDENSSEDS